MSLIKKLLENKYIAWWKKPVIRVFTEPFYQMVRKILIFRAGMQALIV